MSMSNEAASILAAEQQDHLLAPLMVQMQKVLSAHGLEPPYRIELQVTPGDDSSFSMALLLEKAGMRFLPHVAVPSTYVPLARTEEK